MFMYDYANFLRSLKAIRKSHNVKQETLSEAIEMERTAYSRRETGSLDLTVRELIDIANYYKISPASFFSLSIGVDEEMQQVINLLKELPEEDKVQLYKMVDWAVLGLKTGADNDASEDQDSGGDRRDQIIAVANHPNNEKNNSSDAEGSGSRPGHKTRRKT